MLLALLAISSASIAASIASSGRQGNFAYVIIGGNTIEDGSNDDLDGLVNGSVTFADNIGDFSVEGVVSESIIAGVSASLTLTDFSILRSNTNGATNTFPLLAGTKTFAAIGPPTSRNASISGTFCNVGANGATSFMFQGICTLDTIGSTLTASDPPAAFSKSASEAGGAATSLSLSLISTLPDLADEIVLPDSAVVSVSAFVPVGVPAMPYAQFAILAVIAAALLAFLVGKRA